MRNVCVIFAIRNPRSAIRTQNVRHLGELSLEQLSKQRSRVDAGKKIARATGPAGRAGVVAKLRMIEGEIHERGDRRGAAFTDQIGNARILKSEFRIQNY